MTGGEKKIGKRITMQGTAKRRRQYKHRGRELGTADRRVKRKETVVTAQLNLNWSWCLT